MKKIICKNTNIAWMYHFELYTFFRIWIIPNKPVFHANVDTVGCIMHRGVSTGCITLPYPPSRNKATLEPSDIGIYALLEPKRFPFRCMDRENDI